MHLFRGVNTAKLIHSLVHSIDTILESQPNNCVRGSEYIYSSHLMALDTCKPSINWRILPKTTPFASQGRILVSREGQSYRPWLCSLFIGGDSKRVTIGFNQRCYFFSCSDNMSIKNPTIVSEYLQRKVQLRRAFRC